MGRRGFHPLLGLIDAATPPPVPSGLIPYKVVVEALLPMCVALVEAATRGGGKPGLSVPAVVLLAEMKQLGLHPHIEHPAGPYSLDFYFPEAALCIEIDGYGHLDRRDRDRARDEANEANGITTVRIEVNNSQFLLDGGLVGPQECAEWIRQRLIWEEVMGMTRNYPTERPLVCVECDDAAPPNALGWRTYLTIDGETATYCPECAEWVFDDG